MKEIKTTAKKSELTIDDVSKKIINSNGFERQVIDPEKIDNLNFYLNVFITERGSFGKTYNTKEYTYNQYKKYNYQTLWLRNIKKDTEKEAQNFLNSDCPPLLKQELHRAGEIDKGTLALYNDSAVPYLKFQSINTGEDEKGTRILYKYIVWDEFNVNNNRVKDILVKFDSILHSTENIVDNYGGEDKTKFFIFANYKSVNHPLLIKLGVKSIRHEITEYWIDDFPFMLLVAPQRDKSYKDKFIRENKRNGRFLLSSMLGLADHSYFNSALFDEVNFVDELFRRAQEIIKVKKLNFKIWDFFLPIYTVYHQKRYYTIMKLDTQFITSKLETKYHIVEVQHNDLPEINGVKKFYVINHNDITEGALTPKGAIVKRNLKNLLTRCQISFEDIAVRELFISSIKN